MNSVMYTHRTNKEECGQCQAACQVGVHSLTLVMDVFCSEVNNQRKWEELIIDSLMHADDTRALSM